MLVGLRPGRSSLRLESSVVKRTVDEVLLVHCYGLGGSGFTIGPGLAEDIVINHVLPYLQGRKVADEGAHEVEVRGAAERSVSF